MSIIPIKRREPALGDVPDYSCALYPDPPSHDFCVWLIIAELMRRHHKAASPLKVKFATINDQLGYLDFGPNSLRSGIAHPCCLPLPYHVTMMAHVLRPAMAMIGAVEATPHLDLNGGEVPASEIEHFVEYDYHLSNLVDAARAGFAIPQWSVPDWAYAEVDAFLDGLKPVVITLREANFQPERNSDLMEWLRFAMSIDDDYPVLFLRETTKAYDKLHGFPIWPRASTNVFIRAALYQRALVNLMVGNGPNIWCMFSDAPYVFFKQLVPALPEWDHGQPTGWRAQDHMEVGQQFPWALPTQRLAWADDTFENIRAAFDAFLDQTPMRERQSVAYARAAREIDDCFIRAATS